MSSCRSSQTPLRNALVRNDPLALSNQAGDVPALLGDQIERRAVIEAGGSNPFEVQLFEGQQLARGIDTFIDFQEYLHRHLRPWLHRYIPCALTAS